MQQDPNRVLQGRIDALQAEQDSLALAGAKNTPKFVANVRTIENLRKQLVTSDAVDARVASDNTRKNDAVKQASTAGATTWAKTKLASGVTQWTGTRPDGSKTTMNSYRVGGTTGFTAANRAQFYAEIRRGTAKAEKSLWSTISKNLPTGARPNRPAGGYIGAAQSLVGGPGYTYKSKRSFGTAYSAQQILKMKAAGVKLR
jgi:hypothetical protein